MAIELFYNYFSVATTSVLVGVIVVVAFTLFSTRSKNRYQDLMMASSDQQLKPMSEVRIKRFRLLEFGNITRFNYLACGNVIVIWSSPMLISLSLYGTCVLNGVRLDAGLVFNARFLLQIL